MIRIFIFFLLSLIFTNCSLNENSKIWNKKNKISNKNKSENIKIILDEKNETPEELNSKLKLDLSNIDLNNNIIKEIRGRGLLIAIQLYTDQSKFIKISKKS